MPARDKYTVFSPHARGYRKGIHKVPKFTRVRRPSLRFQCGNSTSWVADMIRSKKYSLLYE